MVRVVLVALAVAGIATAEEKKMALKLTLKADKASLAWPYADGPKEVTAAINEAVENQKKGLGGDMPKPPAVKWTAEITNTTDKAITVHVGGDPNQLNLQIKGPEVLTANSGRAFTADFKLPKEVTIEPGKAYSIPVTQLADGLRGGARYIYPVAPGEYTVKATYQLTDAEGQKTQLLTSDEIKVTLEAPKK